MKSITMFKLFCLSITGSTNTFFFRCLASSMFSARSKLYDVYFFTKYVHTVSMLKIEIIVIFSIYGKYSLYCVTITMS